MECFIKIKIDDILLGLKLTEHDAPPVSLSCWVILSLFEYFVAPVTI